MKEAFTYMFKDEKFWQKAFMYFIVIFCVNVLTFYSTSIPKTQTVSILVLTLLSHLIMLISLGYAFSCIKYLMRKPEEIVLPSVDLWPNFISGLKYIAGAFLLILAVSVVYVPILLTKLPILNLLFVVLLFAVFGGLYLAFICLFSEKEMITNYFRFPSVLKIVKDNIGKYIGGLAIYIVLGVIIGLINAVIIFGVTLLIKTPLVSSIVAGLFVAAVLTYFVYVSSYIKANSVDITKLD